MPRSTNPTMSFRLATRALPQRLTTTTRGFSSITARMAEGDTGAPRSHGGGDAFSKREQADESLYIRKQEQEKLAALKKKIADSEATLKKDREEAERLGREQK